MKVLLVVVSLVCCSWAGTRQALPGEESRAADLWERYCNNGNEGGQEGSIFIHCKHPLRGENRFISSTIHADEDTKQREQYIFVQPPPLHFNHDLTISSKSGLEPKTIVYVKPVRTTHTYDSSFTKAAVEHKKPELVFLSAGAHASSSPVVEDSGAVFSPSNRQTRQISPGEEENVNNEELSKDLVIISQPYSVVQRHR